MTRRGKEPAQGLSASQGRPGTGVQSGHIHSPTEPREAPQTGSRLKGRAERTRGRGAGPPSQHRGSWPTFLKHQVRVRLFELLTRTNSCNTTALRVRNYQHPCFTDEQTEAGSAAYALDGLLQGPHPSPLRCAVPPLNVHMSREPPGTQEPSWGARGDGGRASRRQPRRPPCHHGRTRPSTRCRPLGFDVPRGLASPRPPCQDPSPGHHRRGPRLMQQPPSGLPT